MPKEAFEIMKRASIFMILAQTLIYFRPNESYEKYLKLLVHIMLFVVLFFPLVELLNQDIGTRMQESLSVYTKQMEQLMYGAKMELTLEEDHYLSTIEEEIKTKLNNSAENTDYMVERAVIKEISGEGTRTAVNSITLLLIVKPRTGAISTIQVDQITWENGTAESTKKGNQTKEERRLADQYARLLGMSQYSLEVVINGVD